MRLPARGLPGHPWIVIATVLFSLLNPGAGAETRVEKPRFYSVRWTLQPNSTNRFGVEVAGMRAASLERIRQSNWSPAQWQGLLSVYVEAGSSKLEVLTNQPAMLGAYQVTADSVRFDPRFPLEPGNRYQAVFRPRELLLPDNAETRTISAGFYLPRAPSGPPTVVREIYPTADRVPANLLKFYVHFSAPMRRGHVYDYIHLRDENGREMEGPFLEVGEELWDPGLTRLTLFIDPGRIKRGVKPLEDIGPALKEAGRYTLVIDRKWEDAGGNPLKEGFTRTFMVGPADREPIKPEQWKMHPPKAGTRERLELDFLKPMDHALASRVIEVTDPAGNPIEGDAALSEGERRWTFIPAAAWKNGAGWVVIQTTLEDLAGNNVGKPFEVDLFDGIQKELSSSAVKLPFSVR